MSYSQLHQLDKLCNIERDMVIYGELERTQNEKYLRAVLGRLRVKLSEGFEPCVTNTNHYVNTLI